MLRNFEEEAIRELQKIYVEESLEKVESLNSLIETLHKQPDDAVTLKEVYRILHAYRGSGTSYGFPHISKIVASLEEELNTIIESEEPFDLKSLGLLPKIETVCQEVLTTLDGIKEMLEKPEESSLSTESQEVTAITEPERYILLVTPEEAVYETIDEIIQENTNYHLIKSESARTAMEVLADSILFSLIIIEVNLSDVDGYELCRNIRQLPHLKRSTIMFLTNQDQFSDRINALRAGGDDYLVKPIHPYVFLDKIELLMEEESQRRLSKKIVVLDDDPSIIKLVDSHLSQVGCKIIGVTDPSKILEVIHEESPDLIILDVVLPEVDGYELCRIIRQDEKFRVIPIIFLTIKQGVKDRVYGLEMGGDDYITKPFSPAELVARVSAHLARKEVLMRMATTDGLTGIRNRRYFEERLADELHRTRRNKAYLSLAMVDIDHFKKVNDTYGHQTGDNVLKALSLLFKSRLRKTDAVVRYGGEEFVLILSNTGIENAFAVIDETRETFGKKTFRYDGEEFSVTFSAGIAEFPSDAVDEGTIIEIADQRLYQAKENGRNQVIAE